MTKRSHGRADAGTPENPSDTTGTASAEGTTAPAPATTDDHDTGSRGRGRRKNTGRGAADESTVFPDSSGGRLVSAWVGLVLGALVTILLLVFIVQNSASAEVQYFGWTFMLPLGVLVLCAAIAGALIMALFAGVRILQLRMRAHKARKAINSR